MKMLGLLTNCQFYYITICTIPIVQSRVIDESRGAVVSPEPLLIKNALEEIIKTRGFQVTELGLQFRASICHLLLPALSNFRLVSCFIGCDTHRICISKCAPILQYKNLTIQVVSVQCQKGGNIFF